MLQIFIQLDFLRQFVKISVDHYAHIAAFTCLGKDFLMAPLSAAHHRSQKLDPGSLRQFHDMIHHLIHRLAGNHLPAFGTVGDSDPRIEKPEIIIDLRHRPHRGAGISVGGFLIDGYGRGQSFDTVHIRFLHLPQKLPGIRGQTFHITPLSFRINGVKGQGAFPGTGKPRQDHKFISGNIHVEAFQIIFPCPPYFNILFFL